MKSIKNPFIKLWLIIGIISGFGTITFFVITYLQKKVLCDMNCTQSDAVVGALILIGLFGLFIGSLTYYFMSEKKEKDISKINTIINKDLNYTLNFLETNQRKIINAIIKNNGEILQSKLVLETKLTRVMISRIIKELEEKELIIKEQSGMTNKIKLNKNLKMLFCE